MRESRRDAGEEVFALGVLRFASVGLGLGAAFVTDLRWTVVRSFVLHGNAGAKVG